jgi:Uma2 family endonuclease
MTTAAQKLITAEEFARLPDPPDGSRQELVRGVVVTMPPPGFEHGDIQANVIYFLKHHARAQRLGRVTAESGVWTERGPDTVRGPDVAFWSAARLPPEQRPLGYADVAPDLCVEVRSPDQPRKALREKVREYLGGGVRMVWLLDPEDRTVTVYRTPDQGQVLHEAALLSGEDVVPGFSVAVADLFA